MYGLHNRREFSDAVYVRYTRALPNFPLLYACGQPNSIIMPSTVLKEGLCTKFGLLANFCSDVIRNVEIESKLAPLAGVVLQTGANTAGESRSDIGP